MWNFRTYRNVVDKLVLLYDILQKKKWCIEGLKSKNYKKSVYLFTGDITAQIALQPGLKFNGGGHSNHSIFWTNLSPTGGGEPKGELLEASNVILVPSTNLRRS